MASPGNELFSRFEGFLLVNKLPSACPKALFLIPEDSQLGVQTPHSKAFCPGLDPCPELAFPLRDCKGRCLGDQESKQWA